jgi:hypothetical protein
MRPKGVRAHIFVVIDRMTAVATVWKPHDLMKTSNTTSCRLMWSWGIGDGKMS